MYEKLKSFLADDATFYALLIVLIGVVSFGLGRQSMQSPQVVSPGITQLASIPVGTPINESGPRVVASQNGTKYHLLECPGAHQMSEENKVYFESPQHARAAGYEPAANCPGL